MKAVEIKKQYLRDLQDNFLPFWERAMDTEYGGVFTCFDNQGETKISKRKYIWSQGRFLWIISKLLKLNQLKEIHLHDIWEEHLEKTYQFLRNYGILENKHCVFVTEQNGATVPGQLDVSIFADCFYILGCNAYAEYKNDRNAFEHVWSVYQKVKQRIDNNSFQSEPYPIPDGYKSHSLPMILLNVAEEMCSTANVLHLQQQTELKRDINYFLVQIKALIEENRIIELTNGKPGMLLSEHLNPGHTIESCWFMLHSHDHIPSVISERVIENLAEEAIDKGWDPEFGGLFRFTNHKNEKPDGELIGTPYEKLILKTWDTKLWWPHSEALYTTLLLYVKTKNVKWLKRYEQVASYTFHIFPHPDKSIGEWIQIRTRQGEPLEEVVALPVKDPFHIIRSYLLIIDLLRGV